MQISSLWTKLLRVPTCISISRFVCGCGSSWVFLASRDRYGWRVSDERSASTAIARKQKRDEDWVRGLDLKAFADEVEALGERLRREQGPEDMRHLRRVVLWSDLLAIVGLGSLWMSPNPITVLALSLWSLRLSRGLFRYSAQLSYGTILAGNKWKQTLSDSVKPKAY
eukprot:s4341_g6.t1